MGLNRFAPLAALITVSCGGAASVPSGPTSPVPARPAFVGLVITAPATLRQGDAPAQATFYVAMDDDSRVEPPQLKCQPVWGSSAPGVARVSATGLIEIVGAGDTTIDLQCGDFHAQSALRVRRTFQLEGLVLEKYDGKPIAGATVTLTSGEHAGLERRTDPGGRFVFSDLVDSAADVRIAADDFEPAGARVTAGEGGARFALAPLLLENFISGRAVDVTTVKEFVFQARHAGPVTLTLHADCPVPDASHGVPRLSNRLGAGSAFQPDNHVFGIGLGNDDFDADPGRSRTDASETRTLPPNQYVQNVMVVGSFACGWTATVRHPR
jgi:hypothetical protein